MKMKINTVNIVCIITNALMISLIAALYFLTANVTNSFDTVGMRFSDKVLDSKSLESILENEEISSDIKCAIWNEDKNKAIIAEQIGSSIEADVVTISGDFLAMSESLISGMGFSEDDYEGCILNKSGAWDLWKNYDVIGNTVDFEEKTYYVRGIMADSGNENLIYIRDKNKEAKYNYADIKYINIPKIMVIDDYEEKTKGLFSSLSGEYEAAIIDSIGLMSILNISGHIVFLIAIILICILNCKKIYNCYYINNKTIAITLITIITITVFIFTFVVSSHIVISVKYIPDKCSDFEFIKNNIIGITESFKNIRQIAYIQKDINIINSFKSGLYFQLAVLVAEAVYSQIYMWYINRR